MVVHLAAQGDSLRVVKGSNAACLLRSYEPAMQARDARVSAALEGGGNCGALLPGAAHAGAGRGEGGHGGRPLGGPLRHAVALHEVCCLWPRSCSCGTPGCLGCTCGVLCVLPVALLAQHFTLFAFMDQTGTHLLVIKDSLLVTSYTYKMPVHAHLLAQGLRPAAASAKAAAASCHTASGGPAPAATAEEPLSLAVRGPCMALIQYRVPHA